MQYMVVGADGQEYGPATIDVLKQWAADNRLLPTTQLRDIQSGQTVPASMVVDLFTPQLAPATLVPPPAAMQGTEGGPWSQPPSPSNYTRPMMPAGRMVSDSGTGDFWAAMIRSALSLALFFWLGGIAFIVAGYGLYFAIRSQSKGHRLAPLAIAISAITLLVMLVALYFRYNGPSPQS